MGRITAAFIAGAAAMLVTVMWAAHDLKCEQISSADRWQAIETFNRNYYVKDYALTFEDCWNNYASIGYACHLEH